MTLDVRTGRNILRVKEMLPNGVLLLETKGGKKCHEHSKNCAPYHLFIESTFYTELAVILKGLPYFVCGVKKGAATMLLCDQCQHGWHMVCLEPPITTLSFAQWSCPRY